MKGWSDSSFRPNSSADQVCFTAILSVSAQSQKLLSLPTVCLISVCCPLLSSTPTCLSLIHFLSLLVWRSKLYLLWCRMLSSERQYVAVLKGVEETFLPLLELSDTPASIRGKAETLFPNWASLSRFHSQNLLPAMEGALVQSLLQQDCFSKYVSGAIRGSAKEKHLVLWSTSNCHRPQSSFKSLNPNSSENLPFDPPPKPYSSPVRHPFPLCL